MSVIWNGIELELLRGKLAGICEEALHSLVHSGRSPSLRERRDCSASLYDADGEMVVQVEHIPVHLGVMPYALQAMLSHHRGEIHRGQVFITNDPYAGKANHLPDLIVAGPLFLDDQIVGFAATMAHHNDVGGMAPRSMSAEAVDLFQEGLRVPPIVLAARDYQPDPNLLATFAANSRTPDELRNDITAQVAAVALAQERIDELADRYHADVFRQGTQALIERSAQAIAERLAAVPAGVYRGSAIAEDGQNEHPIAVSVEIGEGRFVVDFDGTAEQTASPYNAALSNTYAAVMTCLRNLFALDIPPNAGLYSCLELRAPEGSIVNPRFPAAVSATTQVSYYTYEALMDAIGGLAPERECAATGAGGVYSWGGINPDTGKTYGYGEAMGGGGGAMRGLAGQDAVMPPISNLSDTSAESLEMLLPVRVDRYALVPDSGGAGQWPGGRGLQRDITMLAPADWSIQPAMSLHAPRGMAGGGDGAPTRCRIHRQDGTTTEIAAFANVRVEPGETVCITTAGGGGFGAPERTER